MNAQAIRRATSAIDLMSWSFLKAAASATGFGDVIADMVWNDRVRRANRLVSWANRNTQGEP